MELVALDEIWSWIWLSREAKLNSFSSKNWDYQDSDARNIINRLSLHYSSTMVLFSFEISFEEFKYIMSETYKIDYRAKTIGTALFSIFGLTRIRSMDQNRKFSNSILLCKCKLFDWDLNWGTEISSYWEKGCWSSKQNKNNGQFCCFWLSGSWWKEQKIWLFNRIVSHKHKVLEWSLVGENRFYKCWREKRLNIDTNFYKKHFLCFHDLQDGVARNEINREPTNSFSIRKLLVWSLIEEIELVGMGEIWSWIWISRRAKLISFVSDKWEFHDCDTGSKISDISLQNSSTSVIVQN